MSIVTPIISTISRKDFILKRKQIIKDELNKHNLKFKDLAAILSHNKHYMSTILHKSFSLGDMLIINKLFKISVDDLILPLDENEVERVNCVITKLNESIKTS